MSNGINVNEKLTGIVDGMTDAEAADYVLTAVCMNVNKRELDIIELVTKCTLMLEGLKGVTNISATRLFSILEVIMKLLKEVAGDGGLIEIQEA